MYIIIYSIFQTNNYILRFFTIICAISYAFFLATFKILFKHLYVLLEDH